MQTILSIVQWVQSPAAAAIFAALFALSEAIGAIPSVKASGVFQAIFNGLKFIKEKLLPPAQK